MVPTFRLLQKLRFEMSGNGHDELECMLAVYAFAKRHLVEKPYEHRLTGFADLTVLILDFLLQAIGCGIKCFKY